MVRVIFQSLQSVFTIVSPTTPNCVVDNNEGLLLPPVLAQSLWETLLHAIRHARGTRKAATAKEVSRPKSVAENQSSWPA